MTYFTKHILQIHSCFWKWQDMIFYGWVISHFVHIYIWSIFIPFVYQWAVRLLPYLSYCNRDTINMGGRGIYLFKLVFSDKCLGRELLDHMITLIFFWRVSIPAGDPSLIPRSERFLEKEMETHSSILAGKSPGQRKLVGCSPWGHKESGMAEQLAVTYIVFLTTIHIVTHSVLGLSFLHILNTCCFLSFW